MDAPPPPPPTTVTKKPQGAEYDPAIHGPPIHGCNPRPPSPPSLPPPSLHSIETSGAPSHPHPPPPPVHGCNPVHLPPTNMPPPPRPIPTERPIVLEPIAPPLGPGGPAAPPRLPTAPSSGDGRPSDPHRHTTHTPLTGPTYVPEPICYTTNYLPRHTDFSGLLSIAPDFQHPTEIDDGSGDVYPLSSVPTQITKLPSLPLPSPSS